MKNLYIKLYKVILLLTLFIFSHSAQALISFGYRYGTIGQGPELKMMLYEGFYIRAAYVQSTENSTINTLKELFKKTPDVIGKNVNSYLDAIPDMTSKSVPVMVDYHFFPRSGFKVSAGGAFFFSDSTFKVKEKDVSNNQDKIVTKKFPTIAPAVTIGYDAALVGTDFINFSIEYGWFFFLDKWSDTIPIASVGVKVSI